MAADECAVHKHMGNVKNGAEVQEHPLLQPFFRYLDLSAIDRDAAAHAQIGELGLPRARDKNRPALGRLCAIAEIFEVP